MKQNLFSTFTSLFLVLILYASPAFSNASITYEDIRTTAYSGNTLQAIRMAEAYLKTNDNSDVRVLLGRMLGWEKEFDAAKAQLEIVLSKYPGHADASGALADVYIWEGRYHQALTVINNGLTYHPADAYLNERKLFVTKNTQDETAVQASEDIVAGVPYAVEPPETSTNRKLLNAIQLSSEYTRVNSLDQNWYFTTLSYKRYTSLGPIILSINQARRFERNGTQYEIDAYPRLFEGGYLYLNYGYSNISFFPRNRYGFEGFFSLPKAFEFSVGTRVLQFDSTTTIYTGSIGKYIGNYWFSYRPYITDGISNSLTIRRYFSTPDSYISLFGSYGTAPIPDDNFDNPNGLPPNASKRISLSGQIPLPANENLILTWRVAYLEEKFPNDRNRKETNIEAGFIWRF